MRATWPGARSGRRPMTTSPLVVSRTITSSAMGCSCAGGRVSASAGMGGAFRRPLLLDVRRYLHLHDAVGIAHGAVIGLRALLDLVHELHARDHLAHHRVLPVQERGGVQADEELRIGAVGGGRA